MELNLFTDPDYSEQTFDTVLGKNAVIEDRIFENCTFTKCNFTAAEFRRCKLLDCTFDACDLSNFQIRGSTLRDLTFRNCKLVGVNWTNATAVSHLNFDKCLLDYGNFVALDLRKSAIQACLAKEADFAETNLSEANCRGTDFAGARFGNTNLTKADFRQALNYSIRPDENKIKKAKFSLPEATLLLYGLDIILEE